jgi:hypothetical protein
VGDDEHQVVAVLVMALTSFNRFNDLLFDHTRICLFGSLRLENSARVSCTSGIQSFL